MPPWTEHSPRRPEASSTLVCFPSPLHLLFSPPLSMETLPHSWALWTWGSLSPVKHKRRSGKLGFYRT